MKKQWLTITFITIFVMLNSCGTKSLKDSNGRFSKGNSPQTSTDEAGYYVMEERVESLDDIPSSALSSDTSGVIHNTESYAMLIENPFVSPLQEPLSTFSIDVDNASYTNTRRFINNGSLPPVDAVRIEEFVNYFNYNYPAPKKGNTFNIYTEVGKCPWNTSHQLVHIGIRGKDIPVSELGPSNLVFLIDVSGSMENENKLPLLKRSISLLVDNLSPTDKIAIVTYAGEAGLVLNSTSCKDKLKIKRALKRLDAGGSTAGGEGIELAYKVAVENLIQDGNNRIILATDGDFNIGASSDGEMFRLIEKNRDKGVFISVLGFGMGNYKDSKMETIADHGNGNYFYIDEFREARKVLVDNLQGTLYAIAKDVKIQIEFNPEKVKSYRLIGYENRMMEAHEFDDDTKDAGELGAGHTVTAIYEIEPGKATGNRSLKYQESTTPKEGLKDKGLAWVKIRFKKPDGIKSILTQIEVADQLKANNSNAFNFSTAVTCYGLLLRDSEFAGTSTIEMVLKLAKSSTEDDSFGYRAAFISMVSDTEYLLDERE